MSDFLTGNVDVANLPSIQPVSGTVTAKIEDTAGNVLTSIGGALNVNVVSAPSSTTINIFATNSSVTYGTETTILTYTNVGISNITQIIAWGTYDGEYLLRINGTIVGGGRTSAAQRTLSIVAPFPTVVSDVITITILEYGPGTQQFRANLIGE
jgi:hypothetical protein